MKRWLILLVAAFSLLMAFYAGWSTGNRRTAAKYEAQIAKANVAAQELEVKYRKKEQENAKEVSEALAARDKALQSVSSLKSDLGRVRQQSGSLSKQLSRAAKDHGNSSNSDSQRLGKCEQLLAESSSLLETGAGLAEQGASLSTRLAADKDTLVSAIK